MFFYLLTEGANNQVNTYGGTDIFRIRMFKLKAGELNYHHRLYLKVVETI